MRAIKLIKNRSDLGAGTRGADMGIDAIEIAAINKKDDYFNCYPFEDIETDNETIYNKVNNSFAKRIGNVLRVCERLCDSVTNNLNNNFFPIVLSGDHSSALGSISGVKAAFPDKRLGVIWIDAHADIHSPYTSPSGNIHGMPLSAALNDDNLDFQINEIVDDTDLYWRQMKNIGSPNRDSVEQSKNYWRRALLQLFTKVVGTNKIKLFMLCRMLGLLGCMELSLSVARK